jgi:outer membrane protein TolC
VSKKWIIAQCLLAISCVANAATTMEPELERLVQKALNSNLALEQRQLDLRQATAALEQARASRLPQVSFSARYSRAQGGRSIEIPTDLLLNEVYRTLNQQLQAQGEAPRFPHLEAQQIELLRAREQDTRFSLTQPIYAPAIKAQILLGEAGVDLAEASLKAFENMLARDVRVAFYGLQSARQAVQIVASTTELLRENKRVNESLFSNGKVTQDQVLRAQAELLALEQQQRESENQERRALNYLNFLINEELDQSIAASAAPAAINLPRLGLEMALAEAKRSRFELKQIAAAVQAEAHAVDLARASYRPTLGFGLDGGIQGESYQFGSGNNFAVASLVLNFEVLDGGARRATLSKARAALDERELAARELDRQIALEVRQALDDVAASRDSLITAAARLDAAAASYQIARKKRDAGSISQVEFLDAQNARTQAELNHNLTRFEALSRLAQLNYALGQGLVGETP